MGRTILFDVNETLLDTSALDPLFEDLLGDPDARTEWFWTLKELFLTSASTGHYTDFSHLSKAALEMTAERNGVTLDTTAGEQLIHALAELPAHDEVEEALQSLDEADFRLAALTNGTLEGVVAQLSNAGISDYFEAEFSADEVEGYKPARKPYEMAAHRLGLPPEEIWMVAAHAWDIAGAAAAGCRTVFINREGTVMNPAGPQPDITAADLRDAAEQLIEHEKGTEEREVEEQAH